MSRLRGWCLPITLLSLAVLAGCASLLPAARAPVPRAAPFDVLGRVLVSFDGRALSANVRWLHTAEIDDIWLMTPTGQALAYLREDREGATFTGVDQTSYRASSMAALTQRALGWELPTVQLQHWLRGVPAPGVNPELVERNADGRIKQLGQHGWRVSYDYDPQAPNANLPRRMELKREAQTLRLVIDTWRDTVETP